MLAVTAWAPGPLTFTLAFMLMQVVSCFVLYDAAFPALVQLAPADGRRRIIHLTLIAGFASSLFWPLTSWIDGHFGWRVTLALYALANFRSSVCPPICWWRAGRGPRWRQAVTDAGADSGELRGMPRCLQKDLPLAMWLVTAGFAFSSLALSAVLSQMVPLLQALGFGASSLLCPRCFGPAQVAVRFSNLVFPGNATRLTVGMFALSLLPAGAGDCRPGRPFLHGSGGLCHSRRACVRA
jgi:hypothetical protein